MFSTISATRKPRFLARWWGGKKLRSQTPTSWKAHWCMHEIRAPSDGKESVHDLSKDSSMPAKKKNYEIAQIWNTSMLSFLFDDWRILLAKVESSKWLYRVLGKRTENMADFYRKRALLVILETLVSGLLVSLKIDENVGCSIEQRKNKGLTCGVYLFPSLHRSN